MDKIKVALIGVGNFGKKRLEALKYTQLFDIIGYIDTQKRNELGITRLEPSDIEDLSSLDALIISSPNHTHFSYLKWALENNIHVLCEKPICTNKGEIEILRQLKTKSSSLFKMGSNFSYFPTNLELKKILKNHNYGKLKRVKSSIGHNNMKNLAQWFFKEDLSGGGSLIDNGIHIITFFNSIFSSLTVKSLELSFNEQQDVEVKSFLKLNAKECPIIQVESSWMKTDGYAQLEFIFENATINTDITSDTILIQEKGMEERMIKTQGDNSILAELKDFALSIKNANEIYPNLEDSKNIMNIIFNAYSLVESQKRNLA